MKLLTQYFTVSIQWLSLFMLLTSQAFAQSHLTEAIDSALSRSCLDRNQTAVSIVALPSDKVVYERNPQTSLLPASVMKVVTTAAALHYLDPEFRFTTDVLYSGERVGDTIRGDLIIRGGGDPKLSPAHLWHIAMILKQRGINTINGRLVADVHFFDSLDRAPSWEPDEGVQRAYNAKLGALSVNYNVVSIHVGPGSHVGAPLSVWLEPNPMYLSVRNSGRTVNHGRSSYSTTQHAEGDNQVLIQVNGTFPIDAAERIVYRSIDNPTRYATETFRAYLQQVGIQITGESTVGLTPLNATLLYTHESSPLSLILKELNTYSNNFIAEQLVKTIAAKRGGMHGSHAEGLKLIKNFLRSSGVDMQGVNLVDGSGLSRQNQLTTRAMTDLLTKMYHRFDIGPDFMSVLRVMGAEGAPSSRFKNSPAGGHIRAKTGTLAGVSTLVGYVATPDNQVFAYALFLNRNRCGHSGADAVENSIVNAIYELGNGVSTQLSRVTFQQ
jgi:D-alanyl-D-alanine carboxypeptidase/D-alanyl-D-alanine-endopeptidase (penicillin-binding protein 4)